MDTENELLDCHICQSPSDDLRLLSCTHSYCAPCLKGWSAQRQNLNGRRIVCPDCRQVTVLPPEGVDGLSNGVSMRVVRELLQTQSAGSADSSGISKSCQFCDNTSADIVSYCVECHRYLCHDCALTHCQRAAFREHQLKEHSDSAEVVECKVHARESAAFYCCECARPMCVLCLHHAEHEHEVVPIQQVVEEYRAEMEAVRPALKPLVDDLKERQDGLLAMDYPQFIAQQHQTVKEQIKDIAEKAIEDIREWEHDVLSTLFYSVEGKEKEYEVQIESLNTACTTGSSLIDHIDKSDSSDVLKEAPTIKQRVEDVKLVHGDLMNYVPGTVQFVPTNKKIDLDFGELSESKLELSKRLDKTSKPAKSPSTKARSHAAPSYENVNTMPSVPPKTKKKPQTAGSQRIAATGQPQSPPYLVAAIDYTACMQKVDGLILPDAMAVVFGPKQSVILADIQNGMLMQCSVENPNPSILVQPDTMHPRGLVTSVRRGSNTTSDTPNTSATSATTNTTIYTCDAKTKTIWGFDQLTGRLICRWRKPELQFPKGIGVLACGHVVVSDRNLCKLFIFDSTGKLVRSFGQKGSRDSQFMCPGFLVVDNMDRILVADSGNKAIKIFNANSAFITSIPLNWPDMRDAFNYQSFCTDSKRGHIYVAQKSQGRIVRLDGTTGQPLDPPGLPSPGFVDAPCAIAVDEEGYMAVTDIMSTTNVRVLRIFKVV